jgi:RimJ/RimL family protein N-acetyltransferase
MAEVIAETGRLILRTWRPEDRPVYLATCNTEAVTRHLNGPATEDDIDAAFARIAKSQEERGFSFWAIQRKSDGALLGYCGLRICDDLQRPVYREVEIGWRLREDAWGRAMPVKRRRPRSIGRGPISTCGGWCRSRFRPTGRAGD